MNRRKFLEFSAASALAAGLAAKFDSAHSAAGIGQSAEAEKRERLGVSTWSLHAYFPKTRPKDFKWPGKTLDLREFPELIVDHYHVHNFEFVNTHFESTEPSYLRDLQAALKKVHGRVVNMPVDYSSDWQGKGLCDPEDTQWRREIEERKKWIDIAAELGALSIRPNPGGTAAMTDFSRPIAAYKELGAYGKSKGVKVLIENHGAVAGKAKNIVAIVQGAGPDWVGTLPDFGNFAEPERYYGLELMFPFAPTVCHARGLTPNAQGGETRVDFRRCVRIAEAAGFKGVYSAEFTGSGDPYQGVQEIVDDLQRFL